MYSIIISIAVRDELYTLEIEITEDDEHRGYAAYSKRRGCFVPISSRLHNYLDRVQTFQNEVEANLSIELGRYNEYLEAAHGDSAYQDELRWGAQ